MQGTLPNAMQCMCSLRELPHLSFHRMADANAFILLLFLWVNRLLFDFWFQEQAFDFFLLPFVSVRAACLQGVCFCTYFCASVHLRDRYVTLC